MKKIFRVVAIFSLIVCPIASFAADSNVVLAGWNLNLINKGNVCILTAGNSKSTHEMVLVPTPPCEFSFHGEPKKAQYMHFDEPADQTVFIIFGTPYGGELPASWPNIYCGTESQGILITDNAVRLSKHVARGGLRCSGRGIDALQFRMFNEPE